MLAKALIISLICISTVFAEEAPPEIPFAPVEGGVAIPGTDVFISNQNGGSDNNGAVDPGNMNIAPNNVAPGPGQNQNIDPSKFGDRMFNGNDETLKSHQSAEEQTVVPEVAITPTPPKPMKRPLLLDKNGDSLAKSKPKKKPKTNINNESIEKSKELVSIPQSSNTIRPKPGKAESVVIAKGKLNRIVTPYTDPKVLTVDNVETKVDGSVVYVATDSEEPISLFISDGESGGINATSLQLIPRDMSVAVEIKIEGDNSKAASDMGSTRSGAMFRNDTPYIADIKSIMQNMGKQQIPQGFTLEEVTDEIRYMTICHNPNLTFTAGQLLSGHDSRIIVMIAQNKGLVPSMFEESSCAGENIMAVSAWPKVRLEVGEKTEVYILMRLPEGKVGEEVRPALL